MPASLLCRSPSTASLMTDSTVSSPPDSPQLQTPIEATFPNADDRKYVLVIGGLGFIGSHTSLELLKAGHNVIIIDNLSNSFESVLMQLSIAAAMWCKENGRRLPDIKFHKIDYRSSAMTHLLDMYADLSAPCLPGEARPSRITGVIHFAAFKSAIESLHNPIEYYRNNVCGLVELLDVLDQHKIKKFVFSSSATVYGTKADLGLPLREEDVVHHPETYIDEDGNTRHVMPGVAGLLSPYARTKYFGEAILADVAHADPTWSIIALRYFNPIGADPSGLLGEDPRGVPNNLFPVITQVLTGARPELQIFGSDWDTRDGTAARDFIHVSDLARGHIAALGASSTISFRTFNLGTGTGTTVSEAVAALEAAAGRHIPSRRLGRRAGDVGSCVATNTRCARELNWVPTATVAQCARDLWNFVSRSMGTIQSDA